MVLTRAIRFVFFLVSLAAPAYADESPARGLDHPVFLVGGQYGTPTRLSATAGVLLARPRPLSAGDAANSSRAGLVVTSTAGMGGFRLAAGGAALALEGPFLATGFDAMLTVTRTNDSPRAAGGRSTYLGGEAGLVIMSVRLSAGVAHRTGPPGSKATIFTWSVGVQFPLGW